MTGCWTKERPIPALTSGAGGRASPRLQRGGRGPRSPQANDAAGYMSPDRSGFQQQFTSYPCPRVSQTALLLPSPLLWPSAPHPLHCSTKVGGAAAIASMQVLRRQWGGGRERIEKHEGSGTICPEEAHVTSTHISLSKARCMAQCCQSARKCPPPTGWLGREAQQTWNRSTDNSKDRARRPP